VENVAEQLLRSQDELHSWPVSRRFGSSAAQGAVRGGCEYGPPRDRSVRAVMRSLSFVTTSVGAAAAACTIEQVIFRSGDLSDPVIFLKLSDMATIQTEGTPEIHPDMLLVNRARAGDVQAFEKLVRQYDRQVFRIAQHITQNREDAEDVVQDAFLKAYEKLEQFQGNSKFYTWLVRIAVNESLMRLRKRRTGRMVSIDEDVETEEGSMPRDLADWGPDPEQQYGQSEMAEILRKTVQGLPAGFRVVFVLRDVEGLSTEETAEALGLSIPAVKSRLLRARLQLRERLSRYFRQNKKDGVQ
jgi:RNA polymerase sigma-70 factor (ECF subfamily)